MTTNKGEKIVKDLKSREISKENINSAISPSTNYEQLYQRSLNVLGQMQENFERTMRKFSSKFGTNKLDTNNPITIFEQEAKKMLDASKTIAENNAVKKAGIDILVKVGYERVTEEVKTKMTDRLYNIQEKAITDIAEDAKDGTINNRNNANMDDIFRQWSRIGSDLFRMKEFGEKEFKDHIKNLSDKELLIGTLNIPEGVGAFGYLYKELTSRIGSGNIFDRIDTIVAQRGAKDDNIKNSLTISCLTTLLTRNKVDDLEKRLASYSKKTQILNNMKNNIVTNEDLKKGFLLQLNTLQLKPLFADITKAIIEKDPKIKQAVNAKEQAVNNVEIFSSKKVNGLLLFDNAGRGSGADFYQPNIDNFKKQGYCVINDTSDQNQRKVVLQRGNDKFTLVLLKNPQTYEDTIKKLKTEDFNLFALRGHCYSTDTMAYILGEQKMVKNNALFIDGGCWNANKLSRYKAKGVNGLMFAYTSEGRGAHTEAFVDKVLEIKEKGGNFNDLMGYYKQKEGNNYFADNVVRPDSVYYYYSIDN